MAGRKPADADRPLQERPEMLAIECRIKREGVFGFGRSLALTADLSAPPRERLVVCSLLEALLQNLPPAIREIPGIFGRYDDRHPPEIRNLRGRPPESLTPLPASALAGSAAEEIFCASGVVFTSAEDSEPRSGLEAFSSRAADRRIRPDTGVTLPFEYRLTTEFDRFENAEIVHRMRKRVSGPIVAIPATPRTLSRLLPARIDLFRLGFEVFRSRFLGAAFGRLPSIRGRCYLSANPAGISVFIEEDAMANNRALPLRSLGIFEAIDQALAVSGLSNAFLETAQRAL